MRNRKKVDNEGQSMKNKASFLHHNQPPSDRIIYKRRLAAAVFLLLMLLLSLGWILFHPSKSSLRLTAHIYQNGELVQSIPLYRVTEAYTLTFTAADGGSNTITVSPNAISVTAADCPDRLCIKTGQRTAAGLPIVCLPHRLVIEVTDASREDTTDMDTY